MFNSGITARELISEIQGEADIAPDIPDENYIQWLNSVEQLLYSEVIREQKEFVYDLPEIQPLSLENVNANENEAPVQFEDVHAIYVDGTQLIKSTVASGEIFPGTYYKQNNQLAVNVPHPKKLRGVYFMHPALKTADNIESENVMVPVEFIDLVKAKLRGEAYKLANEDGIAAKWLNDYNVLLETFKAWIAQKTPNFGL